MTLDRLLLTDWAGEFFALALFDMAGEWLVSLYPLMMESSPSSTDGCLLGDGRSRGEDATRRDMVLRFGAGDDWVLPIDLRCGVLEGGGIVEMVSRLMLVMEISAVVSCTDDGEGTLLSRERGLRVSDSEKRSEARLEIRWSLGDKVRDCEAGTGMVSDDGLSGCFLSGDERKPKSAFIARKQRGKKQGREKKKKGLAR